MDGQKQARLLYELPEHLRRRRRCKSKLQSESPDRVPFDRSLDFYEIRQRAIAAGERYGEPYCSLLSLLKACEPLGRHEAEENRGASYKRLCAAAHMAGFSKRERLNLYWIAEKVSLPDRFAGHIIASLKREGRGDE